MAACQHRRPSEVLHTPRRHLDLTNSVQTFRGTDLWVCLREPRLNGHHGPDRDTGQGFRDLNCFLSLLAFPLGPPCRARLVLVRISSASSCFRYHSRFSRPPPSHTRKEHLARFLSNHQPDISAGNSFSKKLSFPVAENASERYLYSLTRQGRSTTSY